MVHGAIPGSKNGWVLLSDALKKTLPEEAPFPAGLVGDVAAAEAPAEQAEEEAAPAVETAAEETAEQAPVAENADVEKKDASDEG